MPMPKAMSVPSRAMPGYGDPIDPVIMASGSKQEAMKAAVAPLKASAPALAPISQGPASGVAGGSSGSFGSLWAFVTRNPFANTKTESVPVVQKKELVVESSVPVVKKTEYRDAPKNTKPAVQQASMYTPQSKTPTKRFRRGRNLRSGYRIDEEPSPFDPVYASIALQAFILMAFLYLFFISPMPYALGWTNRKPR